VSLIALLRFRVNSAWVVAAAAVVGWVVGMGNTGWVMR
jgi:type III secretory pathway component EscS